MTDHDTMEGCGEAKIRANKEGLDFIPGIEFGVEYKGKEAHILAYFVDPKDRVLQKLVDRVQGDRKKRIEKCVNLLQEDGYPITMEEIARRTKQNMSRSHIAEILAEKNYAENISDSFQKYLNPGRKYYIPKKNIELKEVLELLNQRNYLSALAHPITLGDDELVEEIIAEGVRALEVVNEKMSFQDSLRYIKMAQRLEIPITGGSDCHGRLSHGQKYFGNFTIGKEEMNRLREAL